MDEIIIDNIAVRGYIADSFAVRSGNVEIYVKRDEAYISKEDGGDLLFFSGGNIKLTSTESEFLSTIFSVQS